VDRALRALNRFGLGARIGERARLGDPRNWLRQQIDAPPLIDAPPEGRPAALANAVRDFRTMGQATPEERQALRRRLIALSTAENLALLNARITSERPFAERLVAFWSNHLCVSTAGRAVVAPLTGSYEREAIRSHVFGRFEDMVLASAQHPAMLLYLDNFQSVGPNSPGANAGRARGTAGRGLNENYARELLELHTLGVDGGYEQNDVQELAKILTGWTVDGIAIPRLRADLASEGRIRFSFQPLLHEPGHKTVLGERYRHEGVAEGERAIRALCRHRSTARFVARKLVTHFVADDPPAGAVDRIAEVFHDSDGDLRAVSRALIDLPEAWGDDSRKFRTPQDWLVAMLRAVGARSAPDLVPNVLRQLRHPLWSPPAPNGFSDLTQVWADPDSLLNRAEVARSLAPRLAARDVDPSALLDVMETSRGDPLTTLMADRSIDRAERLALALAGPAFQWR